MKYRLLTISLILTFITTLFIATNVRGTGGCVFLVSCQNTPPNITSATLTCTNGVNHDPGAYWARGYWDTEITYCYGDIVTITLAGCATNNSNHVLKLRSIPQYGTEWVDYGNTGNGSYKTRFELHQTCEWAYAYAFGANILEWYCNPE